MEDAQRALDNDLLVDVWRVDRAQDQRESTRDPLAPGWWTDDDEASSSFLNAMGVVPGGA